MVARSRGLASLRFVVFPRGIATLSPDEIKAATDKVFGEIVTLLIQPVAKAVPAS